MKEPLAGKKSIIGSILSGILVIAVSLGLIDPVTAGVVGGILAAFTGVSFRLGMNKAKP